MTQSITMKNRYQSLKQEVQKYINSNVSESASARTYPLLLLLAALQTFHDKFKIFKQQNKHNLKVRPPESIKISKR